MMAKAIWQTCPGILNDGRQAHAMRDGCWSCAPFWEQYPACPHCQAKLGKWGKTKCGKCKQFVLVADPGEGR